MTASKFGSVAALATICIASAIVTTGPAVASGDGDCPYTSRSEWRSIDDVRAALEVKGYSVARVEVDDNCYEAYARDKDGARREVYVNPVTLKIVKIELDD